MSDELLDYCNNRMPARIVRIDERASEGETPTMFELHVEGLLAADPNESQWDAVYDIATRFGFDPSATRWQRAGKDARGRNTGAFVMQYGCSLTATEVFVSDRLAQRDGALHAQLARELAGLGASLREIADTRDIWCRDYMPIPLGGERFVQFRYSPRYLADAPELATPADVAREVVGRCHESALVVDGGNIVRRGNVAIVTKRVFEDNEGCIERELRDLLEVERLIVIPVEPGDVCGHADGVVCLVDDRSALVNDYSEIEPAYGNDVAAALRRQNIEPVPIPYAPNLRSRSAIPPSTGIYVNLLETRSNVFVPLYGLRSDESALRMIEYAFAGRSIVGVDCRAIAHEGGALHCVTWTRS